MSQPKTSSPTNLPIPARARLTRELSRLNNDPPPGIAAYLPNESDMSHIRAQITGPEGSPFEQGVFILTVHITPRYPFEPPRVRFVTPLYHPNIDSAGRICLDTLKSPPAGSWSPAVSLPSLLLSVRSLMAEPNPDDGLVPDISELYKRNPSKWAEEARKRTEKEATVEEATKAEGELDNERLVVKKKQDSKGETKKREQENEMGESTTTDSSKKVKR